MTFIQYPHAKGNPPVRPSSYKGYDFEHLLEARWAVFFDNIDLRNWHYRYEVYRLAFGHFVPTFHLFENEGSISRLIIVRPLRDSGHDRVSKDAHELSLFLEIPVDIVNGDPVDALSKRSSHLEGITGKVSGVLHYPAREARNWMPSDEIFE